MPSPTDPLAPKRPTLADATFGTPKRPTLAQGLGARLGRAWDTTATVTSAQAAGARDATFGGLSRVDQAVGSSQDAIRRTAGEFGASFQASSPTAAPTPVERQRPQGASPGGIGPAANQPSFANVRSSATTLPAVNPAVPPSQQTYTNSAGRPSMVPEGITRSVVNGVPTYTSTSPSGAGSAPVAAPLTPPASTPALAMPTLQATAQRTELAMPRAPTADPYNTRLANDARNRLLSDIDSLQFQLRGKQTRSARGAIADLAQVQAGLVNTAGAQAIDVAGGNRDAALKQNLTGFEQASATQRTGMELEGELQRTGLEQGGENFRKGLEIARPQYVTDSEGNYLAVTGSGAQRIAGADGATVRMPITRDAAAGEITPALALQSLDKQFEVQAALAVEPGVPPEAKAAAVQRMAELDAQRYKLMQRRPTSFADFRAKAQTANPNATEADLRAFYDKTYGGK